MDLIVMALFRVMNVRLEDILEAFNKFTHEAGDPTLLWVSDVSVGGRIIEVKGSEDDAVVDWIKEQEWGYCLGYDPRMVTKVEFVSASSGSVLRWTRNKYDEFGTFEYQEGTPGYRGAYYTAFNEAVNKQYLSHV